MRHTKSITIVLLFVSSCSSSAQKNYNAKIDSLITITAMPYDPELTGDAVFWNLTKEKIDIIPALIERISDTTITHANAYYTGSNFTIGDICVSAIEEIIKDFPTVRLINADPKLLEEKGYDIYWEYVRKDYRNRVEFQRRALQWFLKNKNKLIWHEDEKLYATSDDETGVQKRRPAGGYYVMKK